MSVQTEIPSRNVEILDADGNSITVKAGSLGYGVPGTFADSSPHRTHSVVLEEDATYGTFYKSGIIIRPREAALYGIDEDPLHPSLTVPKGATVSVCDAGHVFMKKGEFVAASASMRLKPLGNPSEDEDIDSILIAEINGQKLGDEPTQDPELEKPLTFTAKEDGATIKLKATTMDEEGDLEENPPPEISLQYSIDAGNTWNTFDYEEGVSLDNNESVMIRAADVNSQNIDMESGAFWSFDITKQVECSGNFMSFVYKDFIGKTSLEDKCFGGLFLNCTTLKTAPALPATTLAEYCYSSMFSGCTSLTEAPALPATTLAESCYECMFYECSNLATAPALPATTLAYNCYFQMFQGCTNLATAPVLPATTLAESCYECMFQGCTNLATAPALPATTLAEYCYCSMFSGCTSLTEAPELPATTLTADCYEAMFSGCTSLTEAPELPAMTLTERCYAVMFSDCTSLTEAPELSATTLAGECYYQMFYRCSNLVSAPALPATTLAVGCYNDMFFSCAKLNKMSVNFTDWPDEDETTAGWLYNVAASGTFNCPPSLDVTERSNSRIPENWEITNNPVS